MTHTRDVFVLRAVIVAAEDCAVDASERGGLACFFSLMAFTTLLGLDNVGYLITGTFSDQYIASSSISVSAGSDGYLSPGSELEGCVRHSVSLVAER
jgi:hypothetical protein